jgi:hypothetical protein
MPNTYRSFPVAQKGNLAVLRIELGTTTVGLEHPTIGLHIPAIKVW